MSDPLQLQAASRWRHRPRTALPRPLLESLWSHYALSSPQRWQQAAHGYVSETWIVRLPGRRRVVLRRYPTRLTEPKVRFEHAILQHLRRHGFPVPGLIPTIREESFVQEAGRLWAVFEFCQGSAAPRPWLRRASMNATAAGTLAWYHQVMERFQPDGQAVAQGIGYRWYLEALDRYCEAMSRCSSRGRIARYFLKHIGAVRPRLATLGAHLEASRSQCSRTVIHGDFGFENILFRAGEVVGVLDFTNAHLDARVADVAYSLFAFSKWLGARLNLATARMFLKAYQARYPLSREELELVPLWMTYNRLWGLCWNIMKYDTEGWPEMPARFAEGLRLVRWMDAHESSLQAVCRAAL